MTNIHPLLPQDAAAVAMMRQAASTHKGEVLGPEARPIFYAMLAATSSAAGIRVEPVAVGGITGSWLRTERRSLRHGCFTCMAMIRRVLDGADIPAAEEAFALLIARVAAIAGEGRLSRTVEAAADIMWASANAASLLYVTARLRKASMPTAAALEQIREGALRSILKSETKGQSQ